MIPISKNQRLTCVAFIAILMTCASVVGQATPDRTSNFRIPNRQEVAGYPSTTSDALKALVPPEQSTIPTFRVSPRQPPAQPPQQSPTRPVRVATRPVAAVPNAIGTNATRPTAVGSPVNSRVAPDENVPSFSIKSRIRPEDVTPSSIAPPSMTMPFFQLTETPVEEQGPFSQYTIPDIDKPSSELRSLRVAEIPRPGGESLGTDSFPITQAPSFDSSSATPADEEPASPIVANESTENVTNNNVTNNNANRENGNNDESGNDSVANPVQGETVYPDAGYEEFAFDDGCSHFGAPFDKRAFGPDPRYGNQPYRPDIEMGVYEQKWNQCSQRPLIELGRGIYRNGPVPESYSFLGNKNLITPGFNVFGDFRTGVGYNDNGEGDPVGVWANRLNLDFDLRLTATERIHAFMGPLDKGGQFTRLEFRTDGADSMEFFEEFDDEVDTIFFEGDLGYIWGGMTDQFAPFDLPFVVGKFPLLFANGIWINDAVEGFAFTIPARNSARLDWTNFEFTFFGIFDDIDSRAFGNNDNAADMYGFNSFIEAYGGYTEVGYAFLNDRTGQGLSYHNFTFSHTRRFFERISNSVRLILNAGQDPVNGPQTADGQLLLIENSLVSSNPTYYVPYMNFFAGFDRPQALAGIAGPLLNTGINFETDGLTGFPRLTDTGEDAWGGAFGFNLLGPRFRWQWILEAAMLQSNGASVNGDEYAIGSRYQMPINYAMLVRFDAMYGLREKAADISGFKAELRWKF